MNHYPPPTRPRPVVYRDMSDFDKTCFRNWVTGRLGLPSTRAVLDAGVRAEAARVLFDGDLGRWADGALACPHYKLIVQPAKPPYQYAILCWTCHTGLSFHTLRNAALWRLDTRKTRATPGYHPYHSVFAPIR